MNIPRGNGGTVRKRPLPDCPKWPGQRHLASISLGVLLCQHNAKQTATRNRRRTWLGCGHAITVSVSGEGGRGAKAKLICLFVLRRSICDRLTEWLMFSCPTGSSSESSGRQMIVRIADPEMTGFFPGYRRRRISVINL